MRRLLVEGVGNVELQELGVEGAGERLDDVSLVEAVPGACDRDRAHKFYELRDNLP